MLPTVAPISTTQIASTVAVDNLAGILCVAVMIGGKGPYHFVLDTGAGTTAITPKLAAELGLESKGEGAATGVSGGQTQIQKVLLDRIDVGGAVQTNVSAAIVPLPASLTYQGEYGEIDGILGYSFLKSYSLTLDIEGKTASLSKETDAQSLVEQPRFLSSSLMTLYPPFERTSEERPPASRSTAEITAQ